MEHDTPRAVVHWYDPERHEIVCGVRQQTGSTKHLAGVTCPDCLRIGAEREHIGMGEHVEPAGAH